MRSHPPLWIIRTKKGSPKAPRRQYSPPSFRLSLDELLLSRARLRFTGTSMFLLLYIILFPPLLSGYVLP